MRNRAEGHEIWSLHNLSISKKPAFLSPLNMLIVFQSDDLFVFAQRRRGIDAALSGEILFVSLFVQFALMLEGDFRLGFVHELYNAWVF